MNILRQCKYRFLVAIIPALLLTACGGGSGTSMDAPTKGKLSIAITDAPVDGAKLVNVQFTGIELKPASGASINIDFDSPMNIDLLALEGGGSRLMLDNLDVEVGQYNWIRLKVVAEKGAFDSYLQHEDDVNGNPGMQVSLYVPSGNQTGLKLNHSFVISAGGHADFTIDFDLRKSITNPVGQEDDYILKPSMRIVDNNTVGEISGTVEDALVTAEGCSDSSAVYIFSSDVAVDDVDDVDVSDDGDLGGADPITTANVELASDNTYQYSAAFLSVGDYTIAFTCHSGNDESDIDNDDAATNNGALVEFSGAAVESVTADTTTTHDFVVETTTTTTSTAQ